MNEFIDPELGRMVAVDSEVGCRDCAFQFGTSSCTWSPYCSGLDREDGRWIIWVNASEGTKTSPPDAA